MKQYQQEMKWGLIFCVALLLWMVLERVVGLHDEMLDKHATYTMGFAFVAIAIYVFALRSIRDSKESLYSYKDAFVSGLVITLVVTILSPIMQWIIHSFITPNFLDNMIAHTVSTGAATQEEAEAYFSFSSYVMQSVVGALVMGIITTAIVAIFVRQKANTSA